MTPARAPCALLLLALGLPSAAAAGGSAPFVSALRGVLMEDHVDVRDPAWILETSGFAVDAVVADLASILPGLDAADAVEAEYMLGRLGPRAAAAEPALTERLAASPDRDVRYEAVRALGLLGPAAKPAAPAVAAAAADPDEDVRLAAIAALARIDADGPFSRAARAGAHLTQQ